LAWNEVAGIRRVALTILCAAMVLGAVSLTSSCSAASTNRALDSVTTNGVWPGVGKICESGPGGSSSVRGVSTKAIHIAVFNDAGSTIEPGLEKEFVQWANAFADWCNASGGIDGRHIVIDDEDAALFNAAQVTGQACQSDFMAVGGGMALDEPSVPVRVGCGLGQISGYTVSDASQTAGDQVNPNNFNPRYVPAGYYAALAKKYPQAVKKAAMGGQNNPSILEPMHKQEDAAQALGWKVVDFQIPPLSVTDWTPYIQELRTKGVTAVWPSTDAIIGPYLQAMSTAAYKPAFVLLGTQFYNSTLTSAMAGLQLPPIYVETSWWPIEIASQNPSTQQMVQVMHKYASGDAIDFDDEEGAEAWLLWAKSASACGANLTVSCVLTNAAAQKNWSAGGIQAPVAQLVPSDQNPVPSPCFALLKASPRGFSYDKSITQPTQSIWNCSPKNTVELTPKQLASLSSS
jgi:Periplasmic binding protein